MKQYISMWVLTHLLALTPQLSLGSTVPSEIVDGPSHVRNLYVRRDNGWIEGTSLRLVLNTVEGRTESSKIFSLNFVS